RTLVVHLERREVSGAGGERRPGSVLSPEPVETIADDANAVVARVRLDEPLPVDVPALYAVVLEPDPGPERAIDLLERVLSRGEDPDVRARGALRRLRYEPHPAGPRD